MTRARHTLAIFDRVDVRPSLVEELAGPAILERNAQVREETSPPPALDYATLGREDINLGYAGYFNPDHPIHTALARLEPGDLVTLRPENHGIGLFTDHGTCVARLSQKAQHLWQNRLDAIRQARIIALVQRTADQEKDQTRKRRCQVSAWEVPVVEILFENGPRDPSTGAPPAVR